MLRRGAQQLIQHLCQLFNLPPVGSTFGTAGQLLQSHTKGVGQNAGVHGKSDIHVYGIHLCDKAGPGLT